MKCLAVSLLLMYGAIRGIEGGVEHGLEAISKEEATRVAGVGGIHEGIGELTGSETFAQRQRAELRRPLTRQEVAYVQDATKRLKGLQTDLGALKKTLYDDANKQLADLDKQYKAAQADLKDAQNRLKAADKQSAKALKKEVMQKQQAVKLISLQTDQIKSATEARFYKAQLQTLQTIHQEMTSLNTSVKNAQAYYRISKNIGGYDERTYEDAIWTANQDLKKASKNQSTVERFIAKLKKLIQSSS